MNKFTLTPSKSLKDTIENMIGQLAIGQNKIDKTIRIKGEINRQNDFYQDATAKSLTLVNFACSLRHCGITKPYAIKTILALTLGEIQASKEDEILADEIKEIIANKLPKNLVNGRSTGKLDIEVLD